MKSILRVRKLLGGAYRIGVVWLIVGALFLAWVSVHDLFHLEYPYGYYYFFAGPLLMLLQIVLVKALRVAAQIVARKRLRSADPHYRAANAYMRSSAFDRAVAEYELIIGIDPDNPRAYMGRGMVYDRQGKHDLAVSDYTTAIGIDPFLRGIAHRPSAGSEAGKYDLAWAYHYRGLSYLSIGQRDQANKDFESATAVRSVFFPRTYGHVGPPEGLANRGSPMFGEVGAYDAGIVHYVRPCEVVRRNNATGSLYSKDYVGVTCRVCLDNRPKKKTLNDIIGGPLERASLVCIPLVAPKYGWTIFELLADGQLFLSLPLLLLHVVGFSVLWADALEDLLMKMFRPLASRILAKPFNSRP